ncbi:Stk1 family PASTA domain-containing Ser/Thr kinase [Plantibacter flavus]|uniref:Stk1 family PASTA domain-containing Ser/Thr kinase n=1 Tax=Plantibacter TaxID=190323 RepID=UPI0010C1EF3A|nr:MULTISPECIES: Stk1 family PASTA domain-containing Ser/Thr kinase [Plantibacter]MBD8533502.1 Stk1 family PASTA domain-containing Ser/Thr kinase [Plantibacter sp. CFBP 13570]TKJ99889.1 Stk1 family PASTA domain-containing Ser/Thr kinase [Plantibacter flavus]
MADDQRLLAGRYVVGDLIGRGGMSNVFRGVDTKLGRTVAIKVLKSTLATDPAFRSRFRQEAQAASRMAHPTIVRVYDAGEERVKDGSGHDLIEPFIVMEYVEGRMLKDLIAEGPVASEEAVRIAHSILTALEYSHRAGVVHRDIKPGNVMITTAGDVKVTDFGIARAVSDSSTTVAQTTAILGTAAYFSPEQAKGETVDARTDLYSTGVVLFEMLTGKAPFRGDTAVAVAYQHVSERPVKPSSINPKVSPALDQVVLRALAKDRFERYQSAVEFREDLDEAGAGHVPVRRDDHDSLFGPSPTAASSTEQAIRQLTSDDTVTRTQRRPPVVWIWAAIAGIAVILFSLVFWVVQLPPATSISTDSREVPDLVDATWESANSTIEQLELVPTKFDEASSDYDAGHVIRTDPPGGTTVTKNTQIKVYVSTGRAQVEVPDVTNQSSEAAWAAVTAAGLTQGSVTRENSPTVPAGVVLRMDPGAGTSVDQGSTVNLVVSSGNVTLTDVVGQPLLDATNYLQDATRQFTVQPQADATCKAVAGDPVTAMSPAPGDIPQKSVITLTYCTGP